MVRKLIDWAVANPFLVILCGFALAAVGGYAFVRVNVEAYPDPAPAIIEVVAQYPGASAEEMERQVTIPIEVALSGMAGLTSTRSKSLLGLSHIRNQFDYGIEYEKRQQALANSNANIGGDYLVQGQTVQVVRGLGLIGGGQDPMQVAMSMKDPREAAAFLRAEERRRIKEIRQIVITAINNVPICVGQ